MWNTLACLDNSFPFVDGFRANRLNIAYRRTEREPWCYFLNCLTFCFLELKRTECPWITVPKHEDRVIICQEYCRSVKQYLKKRHQDGFITDKEFDYPNKGYFIQIDHDIQDLSSLPDPDSWTPLATLQPDGNYKKQSFVAPFFGEVENWFSTNEWDQVWKIADDNYPSKKVFEQQIDNLVEISANLTNEQKIKAEVWAGTEPKKATPPTKWIIMLGLVIAAKSYPLKESVALIGGVCFNLFHAGVAAWAVKTKYLQKRPIQGIRQKYHDQIIKSPYTQEMTVGALWMPWQEYSLVTPGFSDYVSGHSTFSMACSSFFQMIYKSDAIPLSGVFVIPEYYQLLTNLFNDIKEPCCVYQIFLSPLCSQVNKNYPTAPVLLSWKSWNDLANEIGMSRIYGGIHWENSNMAGLKIGSFVSKTLFDKINWQVMNLRL